MRTLIVVQAHAYGTRGDRVSIMLRDHGLSSSGDDNCRYRIC